MAFLAIEDLAVSLGDPPRRVLESIDLTAKPGSVTLVVGRNGSGKSVLLRAILGLVRRERGTITLDGVPIRRDFSPLHRRSAVLFQDADAQIFGDTVREDIRLTLGNGEPFPEQLVEELNLAPSLDRPPAELSGGTRRLVAIAAALATRRALCFLDEPTTELDWDAVEAVRAAIRGLQAAERTVIIAAHDVRDLWDLASDVVLLTDGRITAAGPPGQMREWVSPANGLRPPGCG